MAMRDRIFLLCVAAATAAFLWLLGREAAESPPEGAAIVSVLGDLPPLAPGQLPGVGQSRSVDAARVRAMLESQQLSRREAEWVRPLPETAPDGE